MVEDFTTRSLRKMNELYLFVFFFFLVKFDYLPEIYMYFRWIQYDSGTQISIKYKETTLAVVDMAYCD